MFNAGSFGIAKENNNYMETYSYLFINKKILLEFVL